MVNRIRPIVIIGAGASGMLAAIAASRVRPHSVVLLEKEARVGRKLLATGNGRCNVLNATIAPNCYHGTGAGVALDLLKRMPPSQLLSFFQSLGLTCREEAEGRVYPYSGQASSVLDALRFACGRLDVETRTESPVKGITRTADGFALSLSGGATLRAEQIIIAAGGKASPSFGADGDSHRLLASLGHAITPLFPAIVPLKLPTDRIRGLKGVRAQARLTLLQDENPLQTEQGEALFTDYGISGVAAMQLGRRVNETAPQAGALALSIQLLPKPLAREEMARRTDLYRGQPMENIFTGLLHKRIALCLLRETGLSPQAAVTETEASPLLPLLSDWKLPIQGTLPFAHAQVTAGGAALDGFDPQTLSSRAVPGLYACGEALDVDGDCGGYNLMWAWASGLVSGQAAAEYSLRSMK